MQNDQTFVTKAELLRRLERGHAAFTGLLSRLTEEQMVEPNIVGTWSVKDVLAHLIAHEQRALEELRHALRGERLEIDHGAADRFNTEAVVSRRGQSLAAVRAAWEASYRQVVTTVAGLTDEEFDPSGPVAQALDDTIDGVLGNNTYRHYAEHMTEIETWLGRQAGRLPSPTHGPGARRVAAGGEGSLAR